MEEHVRAKTEEYMRRRITECAALRDARNRAFTKDAIEEIPEDHIRPSGAKLIASIVNPLSPKDELGQDRGGPCRKDEARRDPRIEALDELRTHELKRDRPPMRESARASGARREKERRVAHERGKRSPRRSAAHPGRTRNGASKPSASGERACWAEAEEAAKCRE